MKNPAGETVAGDTFVGSDFSVIDGTVSRKILVYGDVNRDGVIDTADVSLIEDYLDGTAEISQTAA